MSLKALIKALRQMHCEDVTQHKTSQLTLKLKACVAPQLALGVFCSAASSVSQPKYPYGHAPRVAALMIRV